MRSTSSRIRAYVITDIHSPSAFTMPPLDRKQVDVVLMLGNIGRSTQRWIKEMSGEVPCYGIFGDEDTHSAGDFVNLHGRTAEIKGVILGGFGGVSSLKNKPNHYSEDRAKSMLEAMPKADIFISHAPPMDTGMQELNEHYGFRAFNRYMARWAPLFWLHGHMRRYYQSQVGETIVYGISWQRSLSLFVEKTNTVVEPPQPIRTVKLLYTPSDPVGFVSAAD